jgi:hypothetical protein
MWVTVPYDAVAVGNSIAADVVAVLPDTVNVAVCLAYAPPDTSLVVDPVSPGFAVWRLTYRVEGDENALPAKT